MDQDRRDAATWAKEWYIRQKNRRLLLALAFLLLLAAIAYMVHFAVVHVERTTFRSVEDMRGSMQGRYVREREYIDIVIDGDDIILTYMSFAHYNREYAEKYGYDYFGGDSVYEDHVVEWDYRNGIIKTGWMGDMIVDKNRNIRREDLYNGTFYRTDKPRPEPIDPSTLKNSGDNAEPDISAEEEEALEERQEDIEATEDAAEDAGIEGENNVET